LQSGARIAFNARMPETPINCDARAGTDALARMMLVPGETRRLRFRVDLGQLAFNDPAMALVVEPGSVEIMLAASSEDVCARNVRNHGATARAAPRRDPNQPCRRALIRERSGPCSSASTSEPPA
jgi:hypothetical protein